MRKRTHKVQITDTIRDLGKKASLENVGKTLKKDYEQTKKDVREMGSKLKGRVRSRRK